MFQFHTGSIKSERETIMPLHQCQFQFHTGSIKSAYMPLTSQDRISFNSILVRLKAKKPIKSPTGRYRFQFHTGSIKSPHWGVYGLQFYIGFNSILVRLKVSFRLALLAYIFSGFNSILVRLKVGDRMTYTSQTQQFQFHTGSIKSSYRIADICLPEKVSIPYWFD